jgi:hypothetical protein
MNDIIKDKPWFKEILKKPELQDITLRNIYEFYFMNDNLSRLLPIITSNSNLSIRVLDWFVTNYSKKFNIIYKLSNSVVDDNNYFNVYLQYKCQLKSYKKKLFDPFCRKQRIVFYHDLNKCVLTTIGQLNFFKWAIMYGILDYVEENLQKITDDMIISNKIILKNSNNLIKKNILDNDESTSDDDIVSKPYIPNSKLATNILSDSSSSDSDKIRKKRQELSVSANKTINIHNYNITLSFD